jgi:hypothetical protein
MATTIYKAVISGSYYAQLVQNVMHFEGDDSITSEALLCTDLRDNWVDQIRGLQNIGFQYSQITAQKMLPIATPPVALDITDRQGTLSGAGSLSFVAAIFRFRTATPTRKGRGRYYMGGVHGETVLNGVMHPTASGFFNTVAGLLITHWGAGGGSNFNLMVGPRHSTNIADYLEVQSIQVPPIFGVQRKRNIGVGA